MRQRRQRVVRHGAHVAPGEASCLHGGRARDPSELTAVDQKDLRIVLFLDEGSVYRHRGELRGAVRWKDTDTVPVEAEVEQRRGIRDPELCTAVDDVHLGTVPI